MTERSLHSTSPCGLNFPPFVTSEEGSNAVRHSQTGGESFSPRRLLDCDYLFNSFFSVSNPAGRSSIRQFSFASPLRFATLPLAQS